jgi:hypothetical protein
MFAKSCEKVNEIRTKLMFKYHCFADIVMIRRYWNIIVRRGA